MSAYSRCQADCSAKECGAVEFLVAGNSGPVLSWTCFEGTENFLCRRLLSVSEC